MPKNIEDLHRELKYLGEHREEISSVIRKAGHSEAVVESYFSGTTMALALATAFEMGWAFQAKCAAVREKDADKYEPLPFHAVRTGRVCYLFFTDPQTEDCFWAKVRLSYVYPTPYYKRRNSTFDVVYKILDPPQLDKNKKHRIDYVSWPRLQRELFQLKKETV